MEGKNYYISKWIYIYNYRNPVKGDVSLTGTLSGEIPNGLTNYREKTITLKAGSRVVRIPQEQYFTLITGGNLLLTNKTENATTVTGKQIEP